MSYLLGIDIGATFLRAAVATDELQILSRAVNEMPEPSSGAGVTDLLIGTVETACADADVQPTSIAAAGIGSIGPLDRRTGTIADPVNVSGETSRIQLVRPLGELLDTEHVVLHNDTTCGVIGERHFADAATDNMVYLTISTGIGAGVVADGSVLGGHNGNAGEVGHLTLDPAGTMTCSCGADGHWEAYCSGANLPRYASHLRRAEAVQTTLPVDEPTFSAKDIFDRVGEDDLADLVVERIGRWNTIGFANIIQSYAPTYIAVGGAVALHNPDVLLDPVRQSVSERVIIDVPNIGLTEVGEDVVLKGALLTARRQLAAERGDTR